MKLARSALALLLGLSAAAHAGKAPAAAAAPATTKITWLGHAAFRVVTPKGKILVIDPWVKNGANPSKSPVADLGKVDYLFVTHGHFDHVGDAVEIAKATGARLVANFELGQNLVRLHGFPGTQLGFDTLGNSGGELKLGDEVTVVFTPAVHSSGLDAPGADKSGAPIAYGGNPNGFVIKIEGGPTLYHTGDTAYFGDMEQIAEHGIDVALINIGGHFGMEPPAAARAAKTVKARVVIPHHFKTFPILTQDAAPFGKLLAAASINLVELAPGATAAFNGHDLAK